MQNYIIYFFKFFLIITLKKLFNIYMQNIFVIFIFCILCILIKNDLFDMINSSSNICILILCSFNNYKIIENKTSHI